MADTSVEVQELWQRFHEVVNMTSRELVDWLGAEPDLEPTPGPTEPPPLGRHVARILAKRRTDLTREDLDAMRAVVGIVEEETAGRGREELVEDERRRRRLRNIGHDTLRATSE